ncbi:MAG: hypothetical protein MK100_07500 [Phycisphaerales bacterium]|nr:hypothetical protein [Phycisphaerales bacterium]
MLKRLMAAGVLAAGCDAPQPVPDVVKRPPPAILRISGEGTELHVVSSDVSLGDLHAAIVASSAVRLTDTDDATVGIERFQLPMDMVDPIVRAVSPDRAPTPVWLGVPVYWNSLGNSDSANLQIRAWPVPTELGPRGVVELRLLAPQSYRDELLLSPGEAMLLTVAGTQWPAEPDAALPPPSLMASVLNWGEGSGMGERMYVIIPRFGALDGSENGEKLTSQQ